MDGPGVVAGTEVGELGRSQEEEAGTEELADTRGGRARAHATATAPAARRERRRGRGPRVQPPRAAGRLGEEAQTARLAAGLETSAGTEMEELGSAAAHP